MNHDKYHAIRNAAYRAAVEENDFAPLAAITAEGDQMYNAQDWSNWYDIEPIVYGILVGLHITDPSAGEVLRDTGAYKLCCAMVGQRTADEIAAIVFK